MSLLSKKSKRGYQDSFKFSVAVVVIVFLGQLVLSMWEKLDD